MTAIGEVEGRNILIVDDMIDTAGTICMAADMLMARGAKSVRAPSPTPCCRARPTTASTPAHCRR